jgi:hypothetical protein
MTTSQAKARLHWRIFAVGYVFGFIATFYFLLDAEITMAVAHGQWEIHEEAALQITTTLWLPVLIVVLLVHFCFLLFRKKHPITEP